MKNFKKRFNKLVNNNKGQGIMEYVIITSLIGIICLGAVKTLGDVVEGRIKNLHKKITNTIKI